MTERAPENTQLKADEEDERRERDRPGIESRRRKSGSGREHRERASFVFG